MCAIMSHAIKKFPTIQNQEMQSKSSVGGKPAFLLRPTQKARPRANCPFSIHYTVVVSAGNYRIDVANWLRSFEVSASHFHRDPIAAIDPGSGTLAAAYLSNNSPMLSWAQIKNALRGMAPYFQNPISLRELARNAVWVALLKRDQRIEEFERPLCMHDRIDQLPLPEVMMLFLYFE